MKGGIDIYYEKKDFVGADSTMHLIIKLFDELFAFPPILHSNFVEYFSSLLETSLFHRIFNRFRLEKKYLYLLTLFPNSTLQTALLIRNLQLTLVVYYLLILSRG